jgi:DNA polymerase-3 subunit gamma/tau
MTTNDNTKHIELYKKYRPRTWSQVIGQDAVVNDLRNAVINHRLADAYIFAGPRGTGKTSVAKIMSKAVNCQHLTDDGEPCNVCDVCTSIDDGTNLGVHYLSMANNGSVEDVRRIVDQSRRAADGVNRPVWILDEVHNLSKIAYDSLLIPLEDEHVNSLFIMCTTNVNAMPTTLTSRIQNRAFHLVSVKDLGNLCMNVCKSEGYGISKEDATDLVKDHRISKNQILQVIKAGGVSSSGGSVRETLSTLERILSTGEIPVNHSIDLTRAVYEQRDVINAFKVINDAIVDGDDPKTLIQNLLNDTRSMLFLANNEESENDMLLFKNHRKIAQDTGNEKLVRAFGFLGEAMQNMVWAPDGKPFLELAVLKTIVMLQR